MKPMDGKSGIPPMELDESALDRLALWCPYCNDLVNPKPAKAPLGVVLECPACDCAIAHADWHVGEDRSSLGA